MQKNSVNLENPPDDDLGGIQNDESHAIELDRNLYEVQDVQEREREPNLERRMIVSHGPYNYIASLGHKKRIARTTKAENIGIIQKIARYARNLRSLNW